MSAKRQTDTGLQSQANLCVHQGPVPTHLQQQQAESLHQEVVLAQELILGHVLELRHINPAMHIPPTQGPLVV